MQHYPVTTRLMSTSLPISFTKRQIPPASGVQDIIAMEYRFISALAVLMPAGLKLLVVNPEVRRGMLLLQPENVVVLGGQVRAVVLVQ